MLVQMLMAGGLTFDFDVEPFTDFMKLMWRNDQIYGYSNGVISGQFNNSFKLTMPRYLPTVPADYKLIRPVRNIAKIKASWTAMAAIYGTLENANAKQMEIDKHAHADLQLAHWNTVLTGVPNVLVIDYDATCANPAATVAAIAAHINTPTFTFDQAAAAAVVSAAKYINR